MPDSVPPPAAERLHSSYGGRPRATLADVDITGELHTRPRRPANYAQENRALAVLASELAIEPRHVLQKLVESAAELCQAHTAGVSLLDGDLFRWEAVAGWFAGARGGTMPRAASPCGVCIDRNATQLMRLADRAFPALYAEPRFVEALLIPFHHQGVPIGTVWIVSHTEDRKFDAEDERVVRVLAQLASSAWQLWTAYEAAADASKRKSDFLALLGHELRGPLGAVTAAETALRRAVDAGATTHLLDVIARQCQHMCRLVDDLLDVARVANNKLQLNRTLVDVRAVVSDALQSRSDLIERHAHLVHVDLGAGPIALRIDPVRVTQIVANLVDNAVKYTPDGGRITIAVTSDADEVRLSVSDNGIGLPLDKLATVFEPFAQLDPSHQAGNGGLGLGLPLVRSLAELHGGSVEATSPGPGKGSCFTVRLPVRHEAEEQATISAAGARHPL